MTPTTPPRRPTSVPVPINLDPFASSTSLTHLQLPNQVESPQTTITPGSTCSQLTERSAGIELAYVAERSSADLINILDLSLITPRKSGSLPSEMPNIINQSDRGVSGKPISPPLTPQRPYPVSPSSLGTGKANPVSMATIKTQSSGEAARAQLTPTPPAHPPRPPVSPLDLVDTDETEVLQPPPLSAFHASPQRQGMSPPARNTEQRSPPARPRIPKAIDDSFLQWSETGSSVPSESVPPSAYASSLSVPEEIDRSFLRMTRTTIFSDFSAPSTIPDVPDPSTLPTPFKRPTGTNGGTLLNTIPEAKAITSQQMLITSPTEEDAGLSSSVEEGRPTIDADRRSSAGTFGPKNARHSIIGSISTRSGDGPGEKYRVNPFASPPRAGAGREPSLTSPSQGQRKLRPLSMSSASDTTYTGSAYSGRALDDTALEARRAMGVYPNQRRKDQHKHPESDEAIESYLRKQSERNDRRIVPSDKTPPKTGPGLGAPIDLDERQGTLGRGHKLTEGAAGDNDWQSKPSPGLPPPLRSHKNSASVPLASTPTSARPQFGYSTHTRAHTVSNHHHAQFRGHDSTFAGHNSAHTHLRSASIDSLPSLHPSLSDSINTLSNLIPPSPTKEWRLSPSSHSAHVRSKGTVPQVDLRARNDLTPEQRAILLRRTRKLEQMLGEALPEGQVEKMVVDPHNTSSGDGTWSPPSRHFTRERNLASKGAGGEGKDSLTDKVRLERATPTRREGDHRSGTPSPEDNPQPKRFESAPTTAATFASSASGWPVEDDDDDAIRRNRRQQLAKLHRLLGAPIPPELLNPYIPPQSPGSGSLTTADQGGRLTPTPAPRVPSPSEQSYITFDDPPSTGGRWKLKTLNSSFRRKGSSTPAQPVVPDNASFIDMRSSKSSHGGGMSKEEKSTMRKRSAKLEQMLGDRPPIEMYMSSPLPSPQPSRTRTPAPPSNTIQAPTLGTDRHSGSFDAYNASLQGLLYLVENDQTKLAEMMDTLNAGGSVPVSTKGQGASHSHGHDYGHGHGHSPGQSSSLDSSRTRTPPSPVLDSPRSPNINDTFLDFSPSPNTPVHHGLSASSSPEYGGVEAEVDPQSHSMRRRRTGKLSQFFGESVDLSLPPDSHPPPRLRPPSQAQGQIQVGKYRDGWRARRETLDAVLGEMWRNVQAEVGRGGMRNDEAQKLGALLGLVRERERGERGRPWEMI